MANLEELNYLDMLRDIMKHGVEKENRTGIKTKSLWWQSMTFDLSKSFPLYTSRFIPFRIGFEEMMMFLRGETNTQVLEDKNIFIWHDNTKREFLDSRGLFHLPEKDMGKGSYSHSMRNFGGTDDVKGVDQFVNLIEGIKKDPNGRRHMISYWNPMQVEEAALPPCHIMFSCQIVNDKINTGLVMRSNDMYLGNPSNVSQYALLSHLVAKLTGYTVGTMGYLGFDCHIYENQYDVVKEQLERFPNDFPQFKWKKDISTIDEALDLKYEDIEIVGYNHCGKLKKVNMAI